MELQEGQVTVRFEVYRDIESWPAFFLFEGTIGLQTVKSDEPKIGRVWGCFSPLVCDLEALSDSADADCYEALELLDLPWDEGFEPSFRDDPHGAWLGVAGMRLGHPFRGQKIGYWAMRETVKLFAGGACCLVSIKPQLPFEEDERNKSNAEREKGISKLQAYWSQFGFRPAGSSRIFFHDSNRTWPADSWMKQTDVP